MWHCKNINKIVKLSVQTTDLFNRITEHDNNLTLNNLKLNIITEHDHNRPIT